ncbi:conserved hypothetical protein [Desulfamplus magnetovallimortis]|uniref:YcaO domain-containing protein n=1 Tax=Desulfamplus magnetovallimortis TaxID=1246637 RepID=L0R431_9BACT|nr:YcaO-like family protein [Desulfamplus magnetovallimortis]CCO06798.1 conserved hypothetical protein [Desulfamplus magnetovallimortis BW-1]SLM32849.1 conserved hypothetical protein [Desulfamplus magnetovallimortis]
MTASYKQLADAFKVEGADHDKITSPEATIENFKSRSRTASLKILKETRRIDNNRLGIPVYYSICGHDAGRLTGTRKQMGKGVTPALAEASAVMELAERFSLYSFMDNESNIFKTTFEKIDNEKKCEAISFDLLLKSVETNNVANPYSSKEKEKLLRIFSMLELKWVKAFNHTTCKEIFIPMDWFFMINEFNGSSAGNCHEEAICQGACEIIERHVSAIVCKSKNLDIPSIDPDSVTNPSNVDLIRKFHNAGIKIYINDFSLNTGVPTIGVLAYDPSTFPDSSEIVWTAGTAPSPDKALSRALTEVAQLAGDFNTSSNYVASGLPKYKTLEEASHIIDPIEKGESSKISLGELPDISSSNIKDEVEAIINAMKKLGFELIIVDTTDPRLCIPACYTVVPGAQFRERAENSSIPMFAARHVYSNNAPEKACDILEKISLIMPDQYCIEFYLGLCNMELQEYNKALVNLEAAMQMNPSIQDIPSICSYTGICLKELGDYKRAIELLEHGVSIDDERPDLYNLLGFCHFQLKEHETSISYFEKVLKITPASGIDHASIASNYRELGNFEKALDYYEMALNLDPSLDFAKENMIRLKKQVNHP